MRTVPVCLIFLLLWQPNASAGVNFGSFEGRIITRPVTNSVVKPVTTQVNIRPGR